MNRKLNLYKIVLLSSIILTALLYFLNNEIARVVCAIVAASAFVYLFIQTFQLASKIEDISNEKDEIDKKLKKSEELRGAMRSVIIKDEDVIKKQEAEIEKLKKNLYLVIQRQYDSEVGNNCTKYLNEFNSNIVGPYIEFLRSVDLPLSDSDKHTIIDKTIDIAMIAVDMADSYDWNINNRDEQKLNLGILLAELSREEAFDKARAITDNPAVTPRWIRALSTSLDSVVSETSNIIFSGYKKQEHSEQQ